MEAVLKIFLFPIVLIGFVILGISSLLKIIAGYMLFDASIVKKEIKQLTRLIRS